MMFEEPPRPREPRREWWLNLGVLVCFLIGLAAVSLFALAVVVGLVAVAVRGACVFAGAA